MFISFTLKKQYRLSEGFLRMLTHAHTYAIYIFIDIDVIYTCIIFLHMIRHLLLRYIDFLLSKKSIFPSNVQAVLKQLTQQCGDAWDSVNVIGLEAMYQHVSMVSAASMLWISGDKANITCIYISNGNYEETIPEWIWSLSMYSLRLTNPWWILWDSIILDQHAHNTY